MIDHETVSSSSNIGAAVVPDRKPFYRRWALWLCLLFLLCTAYSLVWYYFAGKLEQRVREELAELDLAKSGAFCENLHMAGFPLRLDVICSSVSFKRPLEGISVNAGKLSSGSAIYAPSSLRVSLDGPAYVELPGLIPLELTWSYAATDSTLAKPLPENIALRLNDLAVHAVAGNNALIASLGAVNIEASGFSGPFELTGRFSELTFAPFIVGSAKIPEIDGLFDIEFANAGALLDNRDVSLKERLRGQSGMIRQSLISTMNGGRISMSGPFFIDGDGQMSADLKIVLVNAGALAQTAQMLAPHHGSTLSTVVFALSAMPKDENGNPVIDLVIREGKARAGFIPLGTLPNL